MTLEETAKTQREYNSRLEAWKEYNGDDRVVLASELKTELDKKPRVPSMHIASGFPRLDSCIGGFQRGELIIISAPTGMGKTTLCQSFTYEFAEQGIFPLWFSFEVVAEDLIERFSYQMPTFVLPSKMSTGGIGWIEERIWEGLAKYNSKIVFIDHLHYLLDMKTLMGTNASLAIGSLMREIKILALKTKTTIFLISHMKKTRTENEPEIGDLRDSSFVGQEADMVFVTWRPKEKDIKTQQMVYGDSFVKVEKNRRKGSLVTIPLQYEKGRLFEREGQYETSN